MYTVNTTFTKIQLTCYNINYYKIHIRKTQILKNIT